MAEKEATRVNTVEDKTVALHRVGQRVCVYGMVDGNQEKAWYDLKDEPQIVIDKTKPVYSYWAKKFFADHSIDIEQAELEAEADAIIDAQLSEAEK